MSLESLQLQVGDILTVQNHMYLKMVEEAWCFPTGSELEVEEVVNTQLVLRAAIVPQLSGRDVEQVKHPRLKVGKRIRFEMSEVSRLISEDYMILPKRAKS